MLGLEKKAELYIDRGKLSRQVVLFLEENELLEDMKEKLIEKVFIRRKIEIVWMVVEHFIMAYCERKNDILEYTKKKYALILCRRIY